MRKSFEISLRIVRRNLKKSFEKMFIFGSRLESKFSSLQEGMIFYKFLILTLKFCNLSSRIYIFKLSNSKLKERNLKIIFYRQHSTDCSDWYLLRTRKDSSTELSGPFPVEGAPATPMSECRPHASAITASTRGILFRAAP